jgi:hypothetical protein
MTNDRAVRRLLRVVSVGLAALIAATFPLWTPDHPWPQIPWLAAARQAPFWWDWLALGVVAAGSCLHFNPRSRYTAPAAGIQACGLMAALVVDQHRLQPWAYLYLLVTAVLTLSPNDRGLRCVRWLVISIYVHSALSKFDAAYVETNGRQLLEGLLQSIGVQPAGWIQPGPRPVCLIFPAGELCVSAALAIPRTRRIGLAGSILMHLLLIWTLGPFGLRHEPGVQIWNAVFIVQNVLLFSGRRAMHVPPLPAESLTSVLPHNAGRGAGGEGPAQWASEKPNQQLPGAGSESGDHQRKVVDATYSSRSPAHFIRDRISRTITIAAVMAPLLEPIGYWDHWPSWAVYSSRPAIVTMLVDESAVADLPFSLQPHVGPAEPLSPWRPVSLDQWSLKELHCPVYPQERFRVAAVAAVADQAGLGNDVLVRVQSSPDRFTGERSLTELQGLDALRRHGTKYWVHTRARAR